MWEEARKRYFHEYENYHKPKVTPPLKTISKRIYISCPIINDLYKLKDLENQLIKQNTKRVQRWIRDSFYDKNMVKECEIFILCLPCFHFKIKRNLLPSGCRKELQEAKKLGKKIFIAYKRNNSNEYSFYEYFEDSTEISGIAGTTDLIYEEKSIPTKVKENTVQHKKALPLLIR